MTLITENGDAPSRRRVVMIAAAFPPTGGPGVQRVAKFAKFLPQFGWQPYVWAVDRMSEFPTDESLLDDLPEGVVVHRRSIGGVAHAVQAAFKRRAKYDNGARLSHGVTWRLQRWIESRSFPDPYGAWARSGLDPLTRLSARWGIAAVFSSFSPASNHWLAMNLVKRTGLPWIADFRDLWTDDYRYTEPQERRRRAHRRLEQRILQRADRVIGVTPAQTAMLADRVPEQRRKFVTIRNGFDPADFANTAARPGGNGKRFVLGYVGRLERRRVSEALLVGLTKLAAHLGDARRRFVLRAVGHAGSSTRQRLAGTGIPCEFLDYVPHARAIAEMRSATVLLVVVPAGANSDTTIPAKPYEYLASGRPILHIGPAAGQCAELIHACAAGVAVPWDGGRICRALVDYFNQWRRGDVLKGCPPSRLAAFNREHLTGRLADLLHAVAPNAGPPLRGVARVDRSTARVGVRG